MQAAAKDLDINLTLYDAKLDRELMLKLAKEITHEGTVDAMVFQNFMGTGEALIKLADNAGITAILFNSPLPSNSPIGKPRSLYKNWIGELLPTEEETAYKIMDILTSTAVKKKLHGPDGKINFVGMTGHYSDGYVIARTQHEQIY